MSTTELNGADVRMPPESTTPTTEASIDVEPIVTLLPRCDKGVLDNQDLLQRIFDHLPAESRYFNDQPNRHYLLWAALTCKAFLDPALNMLWRSMVSLIPLLKLLPAFQLTHDTYVLRGVMQEEDWDRYFYYARKVREFIYPGENGEDKKVANHTKVRLAQLWRSPLLPALRRFICPDIQGPGLFIHTLFLSPTIDTIDMRSITEHEDEAVGSLLCTMAEQTPALKTLSLWGILSSRSLVYVLQLKNLKSLELHGMGVSIDAHFFEELGTMEFLTDLNIDLIDSHSSTFSGKDGFHQLKSLHMTTTLSVMHDILASLSKETHLEVLTLVTPPGSPPTGWETHLASLFDLICLQWPTSLYSVTLSHETDWEHATLSLTHLTPLFQLPELTTLNIHRFTMPLSNAHIRQIASSLPRLQSLSLPYDTNASQEPSLIALYTLAELCPNLKHIEIPIYVKDIPSLNNSVVSSMPGPHGLERLFVRCHNMLPGLPDLLLIAHHLDRLFPHLQKVEHSEGDMDMWEKVFVMIAAFRSVRADQANLSSMMRSSSRKTIPFIPPPSWIGHNANT